MGGLKIEDFTHNTYEEYIGSLMCYCKYLF